MLPGSTPKSKADGSVHSDYGDRDFREVQPSNNAKVKKNMHPEQDNADNNNNNNNNNGDTIINFKGGKKSDADDSHDDEGNRRVKATPLPMRPFIAVAMVMLTESLSYCLLLPFVGAFVAHLRGVSNEEAGYSSGALIGLFMLGQVASSKMWGYLSDEYGRRTPILIGLAVGAIMMFFFGLSSNFWICCLLRLLHGFFNGNCMIAKTVIADITDSTNEANGFAIASITWVLGTLVGPAIGGLLYDPHSNPWLQWLHPRENGFLATHPAFIPCFFVSVYCAASFAYCIVFLKETSPHRRSFAHTPLGRRLRTLAKWWGESRKTRAGEATDVVVVDAAAAPSREEQPSPTHHHHRSSRRQPPPQTVVAAAEPEAKEASITYLEAMRIGPIRNCTLFYMMLAAADIIYTEVVPLWGIADRSVGGLGTTPGMVGILLFSCSVPAVVANLLFSRMCDRYATDYFALWRICAIIFIVAVSMTPLASVFKPNWNFWYAMLCGICKQTGESWGYSLVHMLTAKTAPPGCVGAVYGISQSFASITRCVVPFLVAPLFAWSISGNKIFPFNHAFAFIVSSLIIAATYAMTYFIGPFDRPYTEDGAVVPEAEVDPERFPAEVMDIYTQHTHSTRASAHGSSDGDRSDDAEEDEDAEGGGGVDRWETASARREKRREYREGRAARAQGAANHLKEPFFNIPRVREEVRRVEQQMLMERDLEEERWETLSSAEIQRSPVRHRGQRALQREERVDSRHVSENDDDDDIDSDTAMKTMDEVERRGNKKQDSHREVGEKSTRETTRGNF